MTTVDANATPRTPRLYGASELGVLSLVAPGDAHPRVRHLGGELFAGLDEQGAAVTEGQTAPWIPSFPQVLEEVVRQAPGLAVAADGVIEVDDEARAIAALLDPTRIPTEGLRGAPIVFALANPDPEIDPREAAEHAAIVATGRSDRPNQINNVLAFPGVFRGMLDAQAESWSDDAALAASVAIADVVGAEEVNPSYIIPSVFDNHVAPAVAQAVKDALRPEG